MNYHTKRNNISTIWDTSRILQSCSKTGLNTQDNLISIDAKRFEIQLIRKRSQEKAKHEKLIQQNEDTERENYPFSETM